MKNIGYFAIYTLTMLLLSLVVSPLAVYGEENKPLEPGKVIDKVICLDDAAQSYSLYLPPDYSKDKKWPIIYAFDPAARGKVPVELFREAAAKYGYIVVCTYNVQNGPWDPTIEAIKAVLKDTRLRFSLDFNRIYATGFSGGARASSYLAHLLPGKIRGVILCGAGFMATVDDEKLKTTLFIGVVGTKDFNYFEMRYLEKRMTKSGITYRTIYPDGPHNWPEKDVVMRAVEYLEIDAMKDGVKKKDKKFINEMYDRDIEYAKHEESNRNYVQAYRIYNEISTFFKGTHETEKAYAKVFELQGKRKFRQQQEEGFAQLQNEKDIMIAQYNLFVKIGQAPTGELDIDTTLKELKISELQIEGSGEDSEETRLAFRLLGNILYKAYVSGSNALQSKTFDRAVFLFKLGYEASALLPPRQHNVYNIYIAAAYASSGDTAKAMEYIRAAMKAGYKNKRALQEFEYLKNLRKLPEYEKIIAAIK